MVRNLKNLVKCKLQLLKLKNNYIKELKKNDLKVLKKKLICYIYIY